MMSNWNGTILGPPHVCRQLSTLHESCAYFRCRAFMKIVSTMSGSIAVTTTRTYPRLCNSYPRSIYLAWTREQGRYLGITKDWPWRAAKLSAQVEGSKLPCLSQWKRENTMETILIELRRYVLIPGS